MATCSSSSEQGAQWVIFYADGRRFDWTDGSPWDAPRDGIALIVSRHPVHGYQNIYGTDEFYFEADKGGWQCCKREADRILHLLRAERPLIVFGEMMADLAWREFLGRANREIEERYGWRYVKA